MGLTLIAGFTIVLPVYLGVFGWLAVAWLRKDTVALATVRRGVQVAVVLGMLTWAVPLGMAVNAWDVRRAKAYAERLAVVIEAEKSRSGTYPSQDEVKEVVRRVGSPPILLWGVWYHPGETSYQIDFQDRTTMFGGYVFHGPRGGWTHWVD